MKWFDKWFAKKCKEAWDSANTPAEESIGSYVNKPVSRSTRRGIAIGANEDDLSSPPITFKMFKANGGWAIEFRQYKPNTDTVDTSLYVVNSEEELGDSISKIITMEALKR